MSRSKSQAPINKRVEKNYTFSQISCDFAHTPSRQTHVYTEKKYHFTIFDKSVSNHFIRLIRLGKHDEHQ